MRFQTFDPPTHIRVIGRLEFGNSKTGFMINFHDMNIISKKI